MEVDGCCPRLSLGNHSPLVLWNAALHEGVAPLVHEGIIHTQRISFVVDDRRAATTVKIPVFVGHSQFMADCLASALFLQNIVGDRCLESNGNSWTCSSVLRTTVKT